MNGNNGTEKELKAVLQRHASGRDHDTTFDVEESSNNSQKDAKPAQKGGDPSAEHRSIGEILQVAGKRAIGGGLPGAMAMAIQVGSLMWLRTTMNYQYRYGTSTGEAMRKLYAEGGIRRFYQGVGPALLQGPLSRFGDTAANAGMLSLLNSHQSTENLPVLVKTGAASIAAGLFRIFLMPIDTTKTILQVEGKNGLRVLGAKIGKSGPLVMYHGALGAAGATMVGHYPWFATYNTLNELIPQQTDTWRKLSRNALIGFCSSFVSDCTSNSIRVVKTTKQTSQVAVTYPQAVRMVLEKDGVVGLFTRGLKTRILANGFQGMLFTVLWKGFEETFFLKKK